MMDEIIVTYDTEVMEDGQSFIGETCISLSVLNDIAYNLITTYDQSGVAMPEVEKAIVLLEKLKGRRYIIGSIKKLFNIMIRCNYEILVACEESQNVTKEPYQSRVLFTYLTIIEIDTLTVIPATLSFSDAKKMKCSFD